MNRREQRQIRALKDLGENFERVARRAGRRRRIRFSAVSSGLLALLAACLAFTAPGAALAGQVGDLLGIGSPSSLPPAQHPGLVDRERGIVIASGTTPDGDPYEVVAGFAAQGYPQGAQRAGEKLACLTVDFIRYPDEQSTEICLDENDVNKSYAGATIIDGIQPGDRYQGESGTRRDLDQGRYFFHGLVGSGIDRVAVEFVDREGQGQVVSGEIGRIDAEIAADLGLGRWATGVGMMIAFLPNDGLPPFGAESSGPLRNRGGVPGSALIKGYDRDGVEVAEHDIGKRYSRSISTSAWARAQMRAWQRYLRAREAGEESRFRPGRRHPPGSVK